MRVGIDPKVDYAFKRLFGSARNRGILADLINAVLEARGGNPVTEDLELLNPFNPKDTDDDKLSIVDVKARDQLGRQVMIEMQLVPDGCFRQRMLYYAARLHVQQLHEGDEYAELSPTICICIANRRLFAEADDFHLRFVLLDDRLGCEFTGDLELHTLELPKVTADVAALQSPLECWGYFFCHADLLESTRLPAALDRPAIRRAIEELMMINQSELDRHRYEDRFKYQMDERSRLGDARRQGIQEGRQEGLEEGISVERHRQLQERLTLAVQLLSLPAHDLHAWLQLPLTELAGRVTELESRLRKS